MSRLLPLPTNAASEIEAYIQPETDLERAIVAHPDWAQGAFWGKPRRGHPEGMVLYHIKDVLANVDRLAPDADARAVLRLVAILHDTFKYREAQVMHLKHHSIFAREFAEQFIADSLILDLIQWHDEAYYCWRAWHKSGESYQTRFDKLCQIFDYQMHLYYLFFRCDTETGDKTQEPLRWFETVCTYS